MRPPSFFDFDWRRISRWCLLATLAMFVWLMIPVAKCTYGAFRDIPIGEIDTEHERDIDRQRLHHYDGFLDHFGTASKQCYERTPLLGQEQWKGDLLIGFTTAMLITGIIARITTRRFGRPE